MKQVSKQARHFAIREVIGTFAIENQDQLRQELKKRKIHVTQATLSRDMQEMGVSRVATPDGHRYAWQPAPSTEARVLGPSIDTVVSITANEAIIVIKTLPGCANIVGEFVDIQRNPDIIGTVAGDNTLLVIPSSTRKTNALLHFLKNKLIEGGT